MKLFAYSRKISEIPPALNQNTSGLGPPKGDFWGNMPFWFRLGRVRMFSMFIYRHFDGFNEARLDIIRGEEELNLILEIGFHNDRLLFPASHGGSSLAADGGVVDLRCQADRSGVAER
jgi:hypothetical protein